MKKLATILAAVAFCVSINAQSNDSNKQMTANQQKGTQVTNIQRCPESNKAIASAQLRLTKNDRIDPNNKNFKRQGAPKLKNGPEQKKVKGTRR